MDGWKGGVLIICAKNRGPLVQLMVDLMVHTWCSTARRHRPQT